MSLMKIIFSAALALLFCTGCARTNQVHDKNYVRAIAVSGENTKSAVFSFYDDKTKPHSEYGESLSSLRSKTELTLGKSLFTGHTELVILGDCDYKATLEYLLNEWKVSPSCLVVYGGKNAGQLLEKQDAETLADSIRYASEQRKAPECDIVTVLSGLLSEEKTAEIAQINDKGVCGSTVIG